MKMFSYFIDGGFRSGKESSVVSIPGKVICPRGVILFPRTAMSGSKALKEDEKENVCLLIYLNSTTYQYLSKTSGDNHVSSFLYMQHQGKMYFFFYYFISFSHKDKKLAET